MLMKLQWVSELNFVTQISKGILYYVYMIENQNDRDRTS